MRFKLAVLGVVLFLSGIGMAAQADMTGVYRLTDDKQKDAGTLTIQLRDAQHVRYEFSGKKPDESGALLLVKDKLYAITPQGEVMDMALVASLAGALGGAQGKTEPKASFSLDATGQKETVAGLQGEVYRFRDGTHAGEVVLSKDPRAMQLSQAIERIGEHMEKSMGNAQATASNAQATASFREMREHPALRDKGIVRSKEDKGSSMRLESIQNAPLADALFVLPKKANAAALPGLPNGLPNMNDPQIQMLMKEIMKQQGL
ncbi:MAG: hypothetical protein PHF20_08960 [Halothiobacillaceae bacterium]|nr:hypothetical protein [Halothiobacillaceae bacterium]